MFSNDERKRKKKENISLLYRIKEDRRGKILGKLGREAVTEWGQAEFPNRASRTKSHFSQGVQSIADTVPDSSAVPDLAGLASINEQWGHRLVAAK